MKGPIFIVGAARSRTSLTAGIVERCGAYGGITCGPTNHNKRGQYEHSGIRQKMVKPYLRRIGADPLGQKPLPNPNSMQPWPELRNMVHGILHLDGWDGKRQWYFKGAKLCLIWQPWHEAFPNATWIIARRHTPDIVASCQRVRFMRAYKGVEGWTAWVEEHIKRFEEMTAAGLRTFEVDTDKLVQGDVAQIKAAVEGAGLVWNEEAVREFITPELTQRSM